MSAIYILVGNIGTGKTSYRNKKFLNDEIIICPDEWELDSLEEMQRKMINEITMAVKKNQVMVIDGNNLKKNHRALILSLVQDTNYKKIAINFGSGNKESLLRRIKSSNGIKSDDWSNIHQKNLLVYESPSLEEGFDEIRCIS